MPIPNNPIEERRNLLTLVNRLGSWTAVTAAVLATVGAVGGLILAFHVTGQIDYDTPERGYFVQGLILSVASLMQGLLIATFGKVVEAWSKEKLADLGSTEQIPAPV